MNDKSQGASKRAMSGFQRFALIGLIVVLIASVAARAVYLSTQHVSSSSANSALQPDNYLASGEKGSERAAASKPSVIEKSLPYVTEGSLFGLIGFALGFASRKIFKFALLVIALAFIAIQTLTYFNVMTVEWGPVVAWLNQAILNLKQHETLTQFFTKRVPSIGALGAGYLLGFRRA